MKNFSLQTPNVNATPRSLCQDVFFLENSQIPIFGVELVSSWAGLYGSGVSVNFFCVSLDRLQH